MQGGASTRPVGMWNAPLWKLHSTISPPISPSESEPGPCVQASSVTKKRPPRLNTASVSPSLSTRMAPPSGTSDVEQRSSREERSLIGLLAAEIDLILPWCYLGHHYEERRS